MVPDPGKTCLGLEYFCDEGDEFWALDDTELKNTAIRELSSLSLAGTGEVIDSTVVREPKAYPVYDSEYSKNLKVIRDYLGEFDNLQTTGRNGMHRYNNMDHSMLTGLLAAQNILGACHDLWRIDEQDFQSL